MSCDCGKGTKLHYYLDPSLIESKHFELLNEGQETLSPLGYKERPIITGVMIKEEILLPLGRSGLGAHTNITIDLYHWRGRAESSIWHKTHHWYKVDVGCSRREGLECWGSLTPHSNHTACLILGWTWKTNTAHSHPSPSALSSIRWEAIAIYHSRKGKRVEIFSLVQECCNGWKLGVEL